MTTRRRILMISRLGIGAILGLILMWWLLRDVNGQELLRNLLGFRWVLLVPILVLVSLNMIVRAYRWKLLFLGGSPSITRLFFVENTGIGVNSVAPIRVLAEPIQFGYLVFKDGFDRGVVLASIVLVRVVDLVVTLAMIAIGFAMFPPAESFRTQVWIAIGTLAVLAFTVATLSWLASRWKWMARWHLLTTYGAAWQQLLSRPRLLVRVLFFTSFQWLLLGVAAWLVAQGIGIELSLVEIQVLTLGIMTLGLMLPGLPSGVGPFEFAATLLLSFYGVAREPALAFGIIVHAAFLLPPILVAAFTLIAFGPPWRSGPPRHGLATIRTQPSPRSEEEARQR